jgi:hypothetical protein
MVTQLGDLFVFLFEPAVACNTGTPFRRPCLHRKSGGAPARPPPPESVHANLSSQRIAFVSSAFAAAGAAVASDESRRSVQPILERGAASSVYYGRPPPTGRTWGRKNFFSSRASIAA